MADIVYAHAGQQRMLEVLFGSQTVITTCYLRLYDNDVSPTVDSTHTTFNECSYTGYGQKTLSRGSWSLTQGTYANNSYCTYAEQTFTCSSTPSTTYAYGYYLVWTAGPLYWLVAAQRFDVPQLITTASSIKVTPKIELADWEPIFIKNALTIQEVLSYTKT